MPLMLQGKVTPEEAAQLVDRLKVDDPPLYDRWEALERKGQSIEELMPNVIGFIRAHCACGNLNEMSSVMFEMRTVFVNRLRAT
jgi:hypothetical protein